MARQPRSERPDPQSPDAGQPDPKDPTQKGAPAAPKAADPNAADPTPASPDAPWRVARGGTAFCVYEWAGARAPETADFRGIGAEPECGLAFGGADAEPPKSAAAPEKGPEAALARAFDRQARGLDEAGVRAAQDLLRATPPKGGPRVAVVDASPFGLTQPDASGHGFAVSRTIAALACPDPESAACRDMVRPYVALPLLWDEGNKKWVVGPKGGRFGYFHHLFDQFQAALADRTPGQNLIINLSLGWDPVKTDPNGREMVLMTELLQRAHCEGVLVIAAAGNRTGSEGPILPAAIESAPPDRARCPALADPKLTRKPGAVGYRPLIHAVGAVDVRDERFVGARPWGNPRLVAYGMEIAVPAPSTPTGYTAPRSGTSMSAAIVSGIAAAVWTLKPTLDPHDVMGLVYKSGRLLDGKSGNRLSRTEFCLDEPSGRCEKWPVRRASLCEAVKAASGRSVKCVNPADKLPENVFPPAPDSGPVPATPPPAEPPCRLANCGVPVGPASTQLAAGAYPHETIATCPGCTLRRNDLFGLGRVYGTATIVPPSPLTTIVRTWTWVYPWGWTPQDFWLSPPAASVPFSQYLASPSSTLQAEIIWSYCVGPFCASDSTPLIVQ